MQEEFVTGSYFSVTVICDVIPVFGASGRFTKVSGLGTEFEYEFYNEGGSNYHRAFFKQTKPMKLVMEQGTCTSFDGFGMIANAINLGISLTFTIIIILKDHTGDNVREWTVNGAHLTKYVGPVLDANKSELAVSRVEFIYNGVF